MLYITLAINVVSMFGLIAGILMHSGRGGGLSDMFGGGGGAALGSTAAEQNLNTVLACPRYKDSYEAIRLLAQIKAR